MEKVQKNPEKRQRRQSKPMADTVLKRKNIRTNSDPIQLSSQTKDIARGVLKITPLGGLGEVGKNMTVYEYENDILIVDMGFMFPDADMPGIDYIIPDISYLEDKKDKIRGIIITHAHEDHVGGIPFIWPKLSAPIYAPLFTIGMIEAKLSEYSFDTKGVLNVIDPDKDVLKLGQFTVDWFRVAHSIPDAVGVRISTPESKVVYTGDFKLDEAPLDGKPTDLKKLARFASEGIDVFMSDSTNAEESGHSRSETSLEDNLNNFFAEAKGRVVIASFASQINRIQMVIDAARNQGRKLALSGRSLLRNVEIAIRLGFLKIPAGMIIKVQEVNKYPDKMVVIMSTGSQGESMSALGRMARGEHRNIQLKPTDTVIFSSSPVPGNEKAVNKVMDDLSREGARVVYDEENSRTHASGHPCQDELLEIFQVAKPKYFAPFHGERHMLLRHSRLVQENGFPEENVFILDNGNQILVDKYGARMANQKVANGIILVDGLGIGDVGEIVIRERKSMSMEGVFVVICTVDRKTGKMLTSPDIISRGFIYMRENEKLVNSARAEIKRLVETVGKEGGGQNYQTLKVKLRDGISDLLYNETQRRPLILPVVIEI